MKSQTPFFLMLGFLLAAAVCTNYLSRVMASESVPGRAKLEDLPKKLGVWAEYETQTLDPRTLEVLKPDDYLQRTYSNEEKEPVFLFIGYFGSQRNGNTYHSPQNCLPGAGWSMEDRGRYKTDPAQSRGQGEINQFIVSKDGQRMVTLYWYQGRGRTVASEYWGKVWTVADAVTRQRTDGALVRVMTVVDDAKGGEAAALKNGLDFVGKLLPELGAPIPN
ncbi:MAG: exosortase C-terminal domain/associated protein EpsI [Blastocatellia bacterium]